MTILHPIDALMSVAKTSWDLRDRITALPEADRDRIAEYYRGFGDTVAAIADRLRAGAPPERECADLRDRVDRFPSIVQSAFGASVAAELHRRLETTYQVPMILDDVGRASDPPAEIQRLDEAAEIFRAVGQTAAVMFSRPAGGSGLAG